VRWRGRPGDTSTVKEGWVLKVSDDLLDIMGWTTGELPKVCPISLQDITPYGNDLYHINSIMRPCIATDKPVVGVAITSQVPEKISRPSIFPRKFMVGLNP